MGTEAGAQITVVHPRHPRWPAGPVPCFEVHYELVGAASYPIHDESPRKVHFGPREPRVCSFCERGPATTTFRTVAHVLPAALGNRSLFTNEECDECNGRFSRCEEELAEMLAVQRVVGRVPRRNGWPTIDTATGANLSATGFNELKFGPTTEAMEPVIETTSTGVVLRLKAPAYRPPLVTMALLHSLWLILTPERRQQSRFIRDAIESRSAGGELFTFTVPGAPFFEGKLSAWRKTSAAEQCPGGVFMVQFRLFDTVVLWVSPDVSNATSPSLLAPFPALGGEIQMRLLTEDLVASKVERYEISERKVSDDALRVLGAPISRKPIEVVMRTGEATAVVELSTRLRVEKDGAGGTSFKLAGGQWPGHMRLHASSQGKRKFECKLVQHALTPREVVAAADFMDALRTSRELAIHDAKTGRRLYAATISDGLIQPLPIWLPELLLLRQLVVIQEKLGVALKLPRNVGDEYRRRLDDVVSAISSGQVVGTNDILAGTFSDGLLAAFEDLQRATRRGQGAVSFKIREESSVVDLDGVELELGPALKTFAVESVDIEPVEGTPSRRRVTMRIASRLEVYERWRAGVLV